MAKSYQQHCGVARALDVLGGRWTLLIIRDLLPGPQRYTELHRRLRGITTNLLANRLHALEEAGLVYRMQRETDDATAWALTPDGEELEGIVLALGAWGAAHVELPCGSRPDARWFMVSLKRRYTGTARFVRFAWVIDDEPYTVSVEEGALLVYDGLPSFLQARVEGSLEDIAMVCAGQLPVDTVATGDLDCVTDFVRALR